MLSPTKEEIQKKYNSMPPELKNALFDKDFSRKIFNIGTQFKVSEEEIKKILKIIGFVFLGFLQEEDTKKEILEILTIEKGEKYNLIKKLNSEVFLKYRKILFSPVAEKKQNLISSNDEGKQKLPQSNTRKEKNMGKMSSDTKISSGVLSSSFIKHPLEEGGKQKNVLLSQGSNSDSSRFDQPASLKTPTQSFNEETRKGNLLRPRDRMEAKIAEIDVKNYQKDSIKEAGDRVSGKDSEGVEKKKEHFEKKEADKYLEPIDEREENVKVLKIEGRIKKVL